MNISKTALSGIYLAACVMQEIALFREFSIEESLRYYGRMYSMTSAQIEENIIFLIDFLNLPPRHRRICSLRLKEKF